MSRFNLALKLLWRESRSGELTLLALALLIAVSSSTTISLFADRLHRTMISQAAEFLAADLALAGATPISADWLQKANEMGLAQSQTTEFNSVLLENEEILLASVKAVSDAYPLRGFLKTTDAEDLNTQIDRRGPEPGQAWVEKRILPALKLKLGDSLTVGEKKLLISRVLSYEPDKRGNFYSYSPRVMINLNDLQATGVIQPGSRVHYAFQFSGAEAALTNFRDWLKPLLTPAQRLMDIHDDRPELGAALSRAEQYLGLSSIIVVLIAGVAIAMSTQRYTERNFNTTALLRCLGCKQSEVIWLYTCQFLLLGFFTSVVGCLLGWLAQQGIFVLLKSLLPEQLANPSLLAYCFGFLNGLAILFGFALPPLLRLQKVSPLRVLRRDLEPTPSSGWLIYGLAATLVCALIWRYTEDLKMTAMILGVGLAALLGLSLLIIGGLKLARKLLQHMSLHWRFGLQGLLRNSRASVSQILAFSITLTAMALSFTVRNDLIDNWQKQLPAEAPNHFALNIFSEQQAAFAADLQQTFISSSRFYPVVRGRLTEINAEPVQQRVNKDSQGQEATQRELSLTTAAILPEDNKITAGDETWHIDQPNLVSVEQKLADSLKIRPGDQLTFSVGSEKLSATVANLRNVQWDTMRPNFYMIFTPGSLDAYPSTFLTSFYLPKEHKQLLNRLLKKYPAITILEVDQILLQFKAILAQLTQAVNLLLYFALLAGFSVLFAAVYATLDQRIYEGALLRTLGARLGFLRITQLIEFGLLGGIAGVLAAITTEAILFGLYHQVLHIAYRPSPYLWALLPGIGVAGVTLAGYWGVRDVVKQPPLLVLRR
jgi:putative ABC transport system permease protein